jgi:alpha/beta superfamily hydrolase
LQTYNKEASTCWIAGVSFGAWISMQLLMRRPEIDGFISIAPLAKHYDFSFLAPCPASGLFVNGENDSITPADSINALVAKLKTQKGIKIDHVVMPDTNHFFEGKVHELTEICAKYLDKRLKADAKE